MQHTRRQSMSIPPAWPQVLDFFGTPLGIEPSPGQLSSDRDLLGEGHPRDAKPSPANDAGSRTVHVGVESREVWCTLGAQKGNPAPKRKGRHGKVEMHRPPLFSLQNGTA